MKKLSGEKDKDSSLEEEEEEEEIDSMETNGEGTVFVACGVCV